MVETTAQKIWNKLIAPNLRIVRDEDGEAIGYVCEEFYKLSDDEFKTFLEAHVRMEEE